MSDAPARFPRSTLAGFALGSLGTGIYSTVPAILLLYFMTDTLGIAAAWASLAVAVSKLLDVLVDPVVGALSDRTRSRWGRRRPWLLAGAIAMTLTFVMLFTVPDFADPMARLAYVGVVFTASAVAYSVFAVPYIALPAEMSDDPAERLRIVSWRMGFAILGVAVGAAGAPLLVDALGGGRAGYAGMSIIVGLACGAAMLAAFFATARLVPRAPAPAARLSEQLRGVAASRPFRVLVLAFLLQSTAINLNAGLLAYLVGQILGGDIGLVGLLYLAMLAVASVSMPAWDALGRRLGKRTAFAVATVAQAAGTATLALVGLDHPLPLLYLQMATIGFTFGGTQLLPFAMATDAIQADSQATGQLREATFTGAWTATEKLGAALGPALAGLVLAAFGYVERVADGPEVAQPASALLGISLGVSLFPAALLLLSASVLPLYRLREADLAGAPPAVPASHGAELSPKVALS